MEPLEQIASLIDGLELVAVCEFVCVNAGDSAGAHGWGSSDGGRRNLSADNEIIGTNSYTCPYTHALAHNVRDA